MSSHDPGVSRRARVAAEAFDLLLLGIAVAIASVVAGAWLLLRTRGGAFDLGRGDAAIAMALWMSAVPAWWGLLVFDSVTGGQTPGIAQARLRVEGGTAARLLRLVLRPVATLAWLWVTFLAVIATVPGLPILLASMTVVVAGGALVSGALALRSASARGLHDLVAGTRLVRA